MGINFTLFESAVNAINANSQALSVTGNNIANVNTPGYSRQRVILQDTIPQSIGGKEIGRGVDVRDIRNFVDNFAELRLRRASSDASEADARSETMQNVETLFNEIGSQGLASFMGDFFNSFHEVSNEPESLTARQNVLGKASILVDQFHRLSSGLVDSRELADSSVRDSVTEINRLTESIFNLNNRIKEAGGDSMALADERNVRLKELAQLIDVNSVETQDGVLQVYIADNVLLVHEKGFAELSTQPDATNDGLSKILFQVGNSAAIDITARVSGGRLKGLLEVRDTTIPGYQDTLDELAYNLVVEVNDVHDGGFDLNGNTGNLFFGSLADATNAAALIGLDADVDGIPEGIAASDSAANVPGGNAIALQLAALQSASTTFSTGDTTFTSFYGDLLASVGSDSKSANELAEFSEGVEIQAQLQRERISGVSIEEEQLNLVKFQAAFQAAARMISVATDILEKLSNLI